MSGFKFRLVSQEELLFEGDVSMVTAPGIDGEMGVLKNHTPLLSLLKPGEVIAKTADGDKSFYVSGGVLEVQPNEVMVLCDVSMRSDELDEQKALDAQKQAQEAMEQQAKPEEVAALKQELLQAVAQLRIIKQLRKK